MRPVVKKTKKKEKTYHQPNPGAPWTALVVPYDEANTGSVRMSE
jgi:hypothetical protein